MRIQQKVASYQKIRKWKTVFIGQANRSTVAYLSADSNVGPFIDFHVYLEHYEAKQSCSNDMIG